MPSFCDVALPVPLDMVFTYRIADQVPEIGARVLVPFRNERLSGVVTAVHDRPPSMQAKTVLQVLDTEPVLDATLIKLGQWIAQYYLAPVGEVFRGMLPLAAEIKKAKLYRIMESGHEALHASATTGSSRRSRQEIDAQMVEYSVLDYLSMSDSGAALEGTIRSATGATRQVLDNLVRKKWIAREDASAARDARRTVQIAVLKNVSGKLNDNQQRLVDFLQQTGGRVPLELVRELPVPRTTLQTLVKRGVVALEVEAAGFEVSGLKKRGPSHLDFIFNAEQKAALTAIRNSVDAKAFSVSVLHGVTGSGKTAVYLAAMQAVLESGNSALLLVPEIGLTPAAAANLHQVFGDEVAILHSALSADERAEQWHRIRRGDARIVVGTRSAVFAPVSRLALIVVDEEHDASYKQEETPRYHGRDVAVMRGKLAGAAVVLASATPSIESYHNAQTGKYKLIELTGRVERRPLPEVEIVDMKMEFHQTGEDRIFSRRLIEEVSERLERGEQAMVLLNRRGYSSVVLCRACGETLQCKNCTISLTFHKAGYRMECHYCGYRQAVPKVCPKCASEHIYFLGAGSEKVEERLHEAFPQARIGRLDRDTVRTRHDFERVLNQFHAGEINLLVGTQMIAKGHDVHGVTLVGVVGADYALGFPDFRAAERTFQLLTQVAGRAGRGEMPGKVVLQTFASDHYAIQFAQQHDYKGFFDKEVRFRKWMHYPPFSALANILVRSDKLDRTLQWTGKLGKWFESTRNEGVRVLGPSVAPIQRLKRDYRYHFILKAASREKLNTTLRKMLAYAESEKISRTNVIVDVDALSLL
ncbi:MAG TPA: primosomal protein N' [Verrucomicrobiae bacterium]|jgi:primosomal protein N' (replication factor Y)|nr:primosomal protein N' [Verrucomicrobiae bacterium]